MKRYLMRELRKQHIIRQRLNEAALRNGPTLPTRVPVSMEALLDVQEQLMRHLGFSHKTPQHELN